MAKLKFEELHAEDVAALLFKMVEIIATDGCRGIHDFARARGQTPLELWPEFCAEAGLDECEPWPGYPDEFPTLDEMRKFPGATRKMTGDLLKIWENYKAATGRDKN